MEIHPLHIFSQQGEVLTSNDDIYISLLLDYCFMLPVLALCAKEESLKGLSHEIEIYIRVIGFL